MYNMSAQSRVIFALLATIWYLDLSCKITIMLLLIHAKCVGAAIETKQRMKRPYKSTVPTYPERRNCCHCPIKILWMFATRLPYELCGDRSDKRFCSVGYQGYRSTTLQTLRICSEWSPGSFIVISSPRAPSMVRDEIPGQLPRKVPPPGELRV